jgi:preprotein translocase subunit SecE
MNREFKRRMKREEKAQKKAQQRGRQVAPIPAQQGPKRERTGMRQYIREIQAELKRVMWPTAAEVFTYSVVVVFVVSILTGLVFVFDLGFAKGFINLFAPGK